MCLVISSIFLYLALNFYSDGYILNAIINGIIGIGFAGLLLRNIIKTIKEKKNKNERN